MTSASREFRIGLAAAFGAVVMLPFALKLGLGHLTFRQAVVLAAFVGAGFALFAFTVAPAAHGAAILSGTESMFAATIGFVFLRERPTLLQASGLLVLLAGDAFGDGPADQWIGDALFPVGAVTAGILGVAVGSGLTRRKAVLAARAAAGPAAWAMPEARP